MSKDQKMDKPFFVVDFKKYEDFSWDIKKEPFFYQIFPKEVIFIFKSILMEGYQAYIYGEPLFKAIFYKQSSYRYKIALDMDFNKFCEMQWIHLNFKMASIKKRLNFYFKKGQFFYFKGAYPQEDIIPDFYFTIFFYHSFLKERRQSPFLIENLSYNGSFFFLDSQKINYSSLKENELLDINKDNLNKIKQKLNLVIRLARYIVEFSLEESLICLNPDQFDYLKLVFKKYNKKIKGELITILDYQIPSKIFEILRKNKVLHLFFSEILEGFEMYQNRFHAYDVYWHCLKSCDYSDSKDSIIRIASLFHDIGKPRSVKVIQMKTGDKVNTFYNHENIGARMTFFILKRFGFSLEESKKISKLVKLHMFYYTKYWTGRAVRRFVKKAASDLNLLFRLRIADRLGSGKKGVESRSLNYFKNHIDKIMKEDREFKVADLVIKGNDLKREFDLKEGPIIGKILNYLKDLTSKKEIENDFDTLLDYASKWIENNQNQIDRNLS